MKGNPSIHHEDTYSDEALNIALYRGDRLVIVAIGHKPLGAYQMATYPDPDYDGITRWNRLLSKLKAFLGKSLKIE